MAKTRLKRFITPSPASKGDYIQIDCNYDTDITDYNIRAEIFDNRSSVGLRKATTNAGGGDTEIEITTATSGLFSIYLATNDTLYFEGDVQIEIELEDTSGNRFVVHKGYIQLEERKITW